MQAVTKKEVSCKALDTIFSYAKQKNIDLNSLIVDVPYDLSYLLNKRERVEWWVWCKVISNSRKYFQPSEYEEMGRSFVARGSYWEGILWALFLFTSNKFSRLLYNQIFKIGTSMFSCMKHQTDFKESNRFISTAFLEEGYELPVEWASMCKGVWEQLGTKIGQKGFKVDTTVTKQKVIFDVSWKKESFLFKIKTGTKWLFNIRKALLEITDSRDAILIQYQELEASQKLLQKQTTQLKTAHEISTSIRQSLNIEDTLKAIANTLVKDAGFSFVSVQLLKDIDDNDIDIKILAGTETKSVSPILREIIIKEKKIGLLIVYPKLEMDYRESEELLEYLAPVINISIHDALVLRAVTDYKDNLEQKVSDRTFELQTARDELTETNELLKEAHQTQNRFFTNISHEFRTPLTLILGPSKQLSEQLKDEKNKAEADLIHRSANKLNRLVDELLDIAKIEAGEMKLKAYPVNLVTIVKEIVLSFHSLAERKKIAFKFDSDEQDITAYVDKDKIDRILTNVLSNAFKFTPEGGRVEVTVTLSFSSSSGHSHSELVSESPNETKKLKRVQLDNKEFVEISIRDTGVGIPADKVDKIFNRFYQVDGSHTREHEGTGIGLALTKELVELHKGKIEVESEEGKGSTFRLIFPLGKNHLKPEEICEESLSQTLSKGEGFSEELIFTEETKTEKYDIDIITERGIPLLLIVEDNPDVRKYISMILDNQYKVIEAKDGEDGLHKSFECIPDLIISDVMMPKMDGIQLCNKLKTDKRTSHIPVIMLTAKATMEDRISGFETGADMYITKPFEAEELIARMKNLLQQRNRLHEHFRQNGLIEIEEKNITPVDQKFLQKAVAVINEHISDTSFGVETLANDLAVSRSLLLKKIDALVGEPPSELIKRIRLNTAAKLIERNAGNISEIALEVGYNNPSYFAEAFKKQFGITPSQYHSSNSNKS